MSEVVKAWGEPYSTQMLAERSAKGEVTDRMKRAGLTPVDDIRIVKTKRLRDRDGQGFQCQAAVRAVKRAGQR